VSPPSPQALAAAEAEALRPFTNASGENPYTVWASLQKAMQELVGIIRKGEEVREALRVIEELKTKQLKVEGDRVFNPGWNLAIDLTNLLRVSECIARAAIEREESRGGHTRDDFPATSPEWGKVNVICSLTEDGRGVELTRKPLPQMPPELAEIFEESK
jgi:succinate dehydrogenase / fumarate reductase flavoprotein subunit